VDDRYERLPQRLQSAIFDESLSAEILEIGRNFNLPENRSSDLLKTTGMVFLGFLPLKDLPNELKEKLAVDGKMAISIAKELESKVFWVYKEMIEKIDDTIEAQLKEKNKNELKKLLEKIEEPGPSKTEYSAEKEGLAKTMEGESSIQVPRKEKIQTRGDLVGKETNDKYREPIEVNKERARIVKESGRIKKIF